ncbi:MAG: diacylglycerol kinase family protein [Chloroflexota bacterium]
MKPQRRRQKPAGPFITDNKAPFSKAEMEAHARDQSIFAAMRVDPRRYKANWSISFYARTKYAIAGVLFTLRRERSIRNIVISIILVLALMMWLGINTEHVVIVVLAFGTLWSIETINSAVEAVVDMVTQEYHPMARVAKDVAASATLVATVTTSLVTFTLVGIPLLTRIGIL